MNKKITVKLLKAIHKILTQKINQIFFIVFSKYKKWQINIIKNTKKNSEKKNVKDIKIFLHKKKAKGEKRSEKDIKICLRNKSRSYWSI